MFPPKKQQTLNTPKIIPNKSLPPQSRKELRSTSLSDFKAAPVTVIKSEKPEPCKYPAATIKIWHAWEPTKEI
jgi:hypothetical protein